MPFAPERPRTTAGAPVRARASRAAGPAGLLACVLLALAAVLGGATPAAAHAALLHSTPADGAVVHEAPRQVTLTFSEGVSMSAGSIRVLDPAGRRVDKDTVRDTGRAGPGGGGSAQRGVRLKSGLRNGTYTIAWRAVSADTHPVSGALTFSVGAPSKTSAHVSGEQSAGAGGGVVGALYGVGRYAAYAGFVLLAGGCAFVLACWPGGARLRAVRRLVVAGWVTAAGATLVLLLLRSSYAGSGKLSDVLDLGGLKSVLATKPGAALLSRLLVLGAGALFVSVLFGAYASGTSSSEAGEVGAGAEAEGEDDGDGAGESGAGGSGAGESGAGGSGKSDSAVASAPRDPGERRDLQVGLALGGAVLAAGTAATWSVAEHASTGIQTGLAMPVDVVHLLAVAGWLGGLATLLTALYAGPALPSSAVRRFSRLAFGSVVVLVATGVYQAWRQLGTWDALTSTSYGKLLVTKAALVAVMVAAASASRRWTSRLAARPVREEEQGTVAETPPATEPEAEQEAEAEGAGAASAGRGTEPASGPVPVLADATRTTGTAGAGDDGATAVAADAADTGTVRAAQLARQRAAMDTARRKKARNADPARTGLRRSVLAEAAVAVGVLAVTTVLTNTEPGRTVEATRTAGGHTGGAAHAHGPVRLTIPFDTGGAHGKGTAELRLTPGRSGQNRLRLTTTAPGGKPLDPPEARVALTLPARHLGPLRVALHKVKGEPGRWQASDVQLPMPGRWRAAVTVRTSDIDEVTENRTVDVG